MDMLLVLRENIFKLFVASALMGFGLAGFANYDSDPSSNYVTIMDKLWPWGYVLAFTIGVLMVLHTAFMYRR